MATKLIDLEDRIITDDGTVVYKFPFVLDQCRSGKPFHKTLSEPDHNIDKYNFRTGEEVPDIPIWEDDGEVTGPADETYQWTIPEEYQNLDIHDLVTRAFVEKKLAYTEYVERAAKEMLEIEKRGWLPFVRCLLYVRDKFRENNIVWGVGRGSSCACLIFYLLDINRVDPVKYEIPMEEFFKPEKITNQDT